MSGARHHPGLPGAGAPESPQPGRRHPAQPAPMFRWTAAEGGRQAGSDSNENCGDSQSGMRRRRWLVKPLRGDFGRPAPPWLPTSLLHRCRVFVTRCFFASGSPATVPQRRNLPEAPRARQSGGRSPEDAFLPRKSHRDHMRAIQMRAIQDSRPTRLLECQSVPNPLQRPEGPECY